jgi:sialic acid synthase SpsE
MRIGPHDSSERVLVVAEIGNNHEGDAALALEMVERAAEAGAHAVKLQAIEPRELVRPDQAERIAQLERFRLDPADHERAAARAHELGMAFLCTPFSLNAVDWLEPFVDAYKIASGDNDFVPLIESAARRGKPVIVSSGMGALDAARRARDVVRAGGAEFAVLHCVSAYPTPLEAAHLATIPALARELGCEAGYSDHVLGVEACVVAAALGARILEKHFTLDHDQSDFRDHQLSADPAELAALCEAVARVEQLLGDVAAGVLPEEEAVAAAARRSICAAADLPAGRVLALEDLAWLRPGDGLHPGSESELLGKTLARDVSAGEPLSLADVS